MEISKGTIIRTTILAIALVNQLLSAMGKNVINIADEDISAVISAAFTIVSAIVAWWKNNSFTRAAIIADEVMKIEKNRGESECE